MNLTEGLIRKAIKDHGFKVIKKSESMYTVQPLARYYELFRDIPRNTKLVCINDGHYEYGTVVYLSRNAMFKRLTVCPELLTDDPSVYQNTFNREASVFIPLDWLFPKKNHLPKWF